VGYSHVDDRQNFGSRIQFIYYVYVGYSHMDGRQNFVTRIQFIDYVTIFVTTINTDK
jgi:hypothetical protein